MNFKYSSLYIILLFLSILSIGCRSDKYSIDNYFTKSEQDSLLTNIITYIGAKPSGATTNNRFDKRFRTFYKQALSFYRFEKYFISSDSTHYYFIIRPVGGSPKYRRGVIGRFKIKNNLMPIDFEEVVNTPHIEENTVIERGTFLFKELIKNNSLDKYISMKHYVEWPDSSLIYDKSIHEWIPAIKATH